MINGILTSSPDNLAELWETYLAAKGLQEPYEKCKAAWGETLKQFYDRLSEDMTINALDFIEFFFYAYKTNDWFYGEANTEYQYNYLKSLGIFG